MTSRQVFEYALVELNKVQAPSLLLEDYNYFINKAINQYINKIYNSYEVNQQKSDDLRVLKGTTVLLPTKQTATYTATSPVAAGLMGSTYETFLPDDYLHILNCIAEFKVDKAFKCYDKNDLVHFGAKKLTSDMYSQIINNYYMRPSYKSPYFFINNVNTQNSFPTDDSTGDVLQYIKKYTVNSSGTVNDGDTVTIGGVTYTAKTTGVIGEYEFLNNTYSFLNLFPKLIASSNPIIKSCRFSYLEDDPDIEIVYIEVPKDVTVTVTGDEFHISNTSITTSNLTEKQSPNRYGNKSKVRMEIRYGKDSSLFVLNKVYVDYLKAPQFVRLTQTQVDTVEDASQILEFPDYVCQEIVNELIHLLMENGSDPRLQSHIPVNQSIAQPQGEQQQQKR